MAKRHTHILSEAKWADIKNTSVEVAVLPWGATEAHNYHLPYGTDNYECEYFASKAAEIASKAGKNILVLPIIPYGVNGAQINVPFNINLNQSTQLLIVRDIVESLEHQGLKKLIIINSHGGNAFAPILRELFPKTKMFICCVNTYQCLDAREHFENPGDHAGEMETSIMMHIHPELVAPLSDAGNGSVKTFKIAALNQGWAWSQRDWRKISKDNGAGNPMKATKIKGKKYTEAAVKKIASFFMEVADADIDKLYV